MKVAGIQAKQHLVFYRITKIKFMRTGHIGFGSYSEELTFHGIQVICRINGLDQHLIKRLSQVFTGSPTIGG